MIEGFQSEIAEQTRHELLTIAGDAQSQVLEAVEGSETSAAEVISKLRAIPEIGPYIEALGEQGNATVVAKAIHKVYDNLNKSGPMSPESIPGLVYAKSALEAISVLRSEFDIQKVFGTNVTGAGMMSGVIGHSLAKNGIEGIF